MSRSARKQINEAWAALERTADSIGPASSFLLRAFNSAVEGERLHRRGSGRYVESVATAARYFVLKWALEGSRKHPKARSWADVGSRRLDYIYGMALGETLAAEGKRGAAFPDPKAIETLDYQTHIVGGLPF